MHVLLIAGGWSSEREVSLRGAVGIHKALETLGHTVTFFDVTGTNFDGLIEAASKHDFAFVNLHGAPGEDGLVQAMLEQAGCAYQGSGPTASFLALHKAATKQVLRGAGMLTPDWIFVPKAQSLDSLRQVLCEKGLAYPLFVKSNDGGSSLLLSRVDNEEALVHALDAIFEAGCEALIEPCLHSLGGTGGDCVEITCGVLGDEALPPLMIVPKGGAFFDYHHKYTVGATQEICPAPISPELTMRVQALAVQAHKVLGLEGYSRADFMVRGDVRPHGHGEADVFILEVNTLPGMTETSLVPQEAAAMGLDFPSLIARLMELGLARHAAKVAYCG